MTQLDVPRKFDRQRGDHRSGRLKPRTPDVGLREEARRQRILFCQPTPVGFVRRAVDAAHAGDLRVEPVGARQRRKERVGEPLVLEPVLPQQHVARRRIERFACRIRQQKIPDKRQMMWKARVGVEIELQEQLSVEVVWPAIDHCVEVARQVGSFECSRGLARQRVERGQLTVSEVPARQPVCQDDPENRWMADDIPARRR